MQPALWDISDPLVDFFDDVDQLLISCSSLNIASTERKLQLCLKKVEKWADENGFSSDLYSTSVTNIVTHKVHLSPL